MANPTVLKEFLVSLGFKIDQTGIKNFVGATTRVTKVALGTSAAITGAAAAVEAYVQLFAENMEKLYYSSKRTGAAVENIQALEFGARQIGLQAEDARESLEAMAAAVRMNPGLRGLMNNIVGHDTRGQDTAQAMVEMVQSLNARYPHFIGARIAAMFGMDEKTFFMFSQQGPKLLALEEKFHQMQQRAGVDTNKASEASVEYLNALRGIWAQVSILGQALAIALLPSLREFVGWLSPVIERFTRWIGLNRDLLKSRLDEFLKGLVGWIQKIDFDKVFKALDDGLKSIDRFIRFIGGWENAGLAFAAVLAGPLILAIANLGIAIASFMAIPAVAGFSALLAAVGLTGVLALAGIKYSVVKGTSADPFPERGEGTQGTHTLTQPIRPRDPTASAAGVGVHFGASAEETLRALIRSSWDPNVGYESKETKADRDREIVKMYHAVRPHGGTISFDADPGPRSDAGVILNQSTTIQVAGTGSPREVAQLVRDGQRDVNQSLVRDFASKVG